MALVLDNPAKLVENVMLSSCWNFTMNSCVCCESASRVIVAVASTVAYDMQIMHLENFWKCIFESWKTLEFDVFSRRKS